MAVPVWLQAGLWGLLAGGALLVGAAAGFPAAFALSKLGA